ncbi:MAG TPA: flagellin [Fibrobacteraceae bacterium]|nr:flagellin [Fibrobacteraceae bacterium]
MRINHNISAMITQTSLNNADSSMSKSLEKLSTGLRVNRASDDAAGLAVSERLRSQVRGLSRASMNAQDGIALLQIAEGACNEIDDILQRQRELAVQASSDTLTSTDRAYLDLEFTQLSEEIDRITKSAQYNTMTLLDGTGFGAGEAGSILHIGANSGAANEISIHLGSISTGTLGMSTSGTDAVGLSTQASATSTLSVVDTAMNTVNSLRADLGSYINRLEHTINNIDNQEYNTEDAESRIRDVDFATETTEFTRNQILVQSSTSMLAQANSVPQTVLSLLQ